MGFIVLMGEWSGVEGIVNGPEIGRQAVVRVREKTESERRKRMRKSNENDANKEEREREDGSFGGVRILISLCEVGELDTESG